MIQVMTSWENPSQEEEKASLSQGDGEARPQEDPITRSGFFQGDIMIRSGRTLSDHRASEVDHRPSLMKEYHQRTCVTFVPKTTHSDYVHILKGQGVLLEQSRFDRDDYVTIHWNNIQPQLTYNFDKKSSSVPIWDYPMTTVPSCTTDPTPSPRTTAILPLNPKQNGVTIGQRDGFSEGPTPKPTPEPEDCVNKNQYCAYWAASGFCFTNNAYMKINCKKSCNFCGTSDCEDQNRYCSSWAKNGQCQQNPKYMSLFCKKSCNLCGAASSSCVDHNSYCQDWSRRQECKRNQAYMSLYCSKSCGSL
ncbi:tyrosinase-like protein tyr-3-like 3 [Homarus americanus]|uniref:Tyrosinase-like protein tyr-3-like 3 n=1 Tax=Homarus americanus TaxID=6706 RepID=A0A8J5JPC7_HOMAM|nr:tyrosinase-like protein tyr-3-like 3 [Homarus americanus]